MASATSLVARQTRLAEWTRQIHDCQNRPADMDVSTWCSQHGISKSNYYYRLRRVRQAVLASSTGTETEAVSFVDLSEVTNTAITASEQESTLAGATLSIHGVTLQISNDASAPFLKNLFEAMSSC